MSSPKVLVVPCLRDNYAYLVHREGSKQAVVVDASEAAPIEAALEAHGLELVGILSTHHHYDHVGGNEELAAKRPGLAVWASSYDKARVPGLTRTVDDGDEAEIAGLKVRCWTVPGHTLGAVAYVIGDAVFTGDTLFIAGCGRLFEGTPAQMHDSLSHKLGTLPPSTRVYCGHEYTVSNARFAATIEPDNPAIAKLLADAESARARNEPTVPSTLGAEHAYNPFLRVAQPALREKFQSEDPVVVLGKVRAAKDQFSV